MKPDDFLRRRVVCFLDYCFLIEILGGRFELSGFPEDAIVTGVHHDFGRHSIGVMVASSQFAEVPDGQMAPEVGSFWQRAQIVHDLGEGASPRYLRTSDTAERIETPDGKVKFREFI